MINELHCCDLWQGRALAQGERSRGTAAWSCWLGG